MISCYFKKIPLHFWFVVEDLNNDDDARLKDAAGLILSSSWCMSPVPKHTQRQCLQLKSHQTASCGAARILCIQGRESGKCGWHPQSPSQALDPLMIRAQSLTRMVLQTTHDLRCSQNLLSQHGHRWPHQDVQYQRVLQAFTIDASCLILPVAHSCLNALSHDIHDKCQSSGLIAVQDDTFQWEMDTISYLFEPGFRGLKLQKGCTLEHSGIA